jgi:hypothetical protein
VFLEKLEIKKSYLEFILNNNIKYLEQQNEGAERIYKKFPTIEMSENNSIATKKRRSASTAIPAILKKEIESLELFIPKSSIDQSYFEERMKKLDEEMKKIKSEISAWQKELFRIAPKNKELTLRQVNYFFEK